MKQTRFCVWPAFQPRRGRAARRHPASEAAFTIVELVVILAVLAILACVIATTIARTAPNNKAVGCLNNLRQLGAAWRMYAEDNQGKLVFNHDGGNVGRMAGMEAWVAGWLDFSSSSDNTNTAVLVNHNLYPYGAFLGPYLNSPRPFKCPADKSTVNIAGQQLPRARSISMSNRVGVGSRSWISPSQFLMYSSLSTISKPVPAQVFILVDELENSINDGWFATDPDTPWQLIDYPANRHNGGAAFAFADGHSEVHRWQDKRTMPILGPGQLLPLNVNIPGDVDVQWLQQHAAGRIR